MKHMDLSTRPRGEIIVFEHSDDRLIEMLEQAQGFLDTVRAELRKRMIARQIEES